MYKSTTASKALYNTVICLVSGTQSCLGERVNSCKYLSQGHYVGTPANPRTQDHESSVGNYSTQGSGSNTPATQLVILFYARKQLLYSLLYSETHYSTQEVAGVTTISS